MLRTLLILLLCCLPCFATTYYVDPVSGSDGNAGTSFAAAWKTTQKAADSANTAGDVVRLCQTGTESISAAIDFDTNAGAAGSYIQFVSYNSTGTTQSNGYTIQASSSITTGMFFIVDAGDYLMFTGIILNANSNAAVCVYDNVDTPQYPVFKSCDFKNATSHGVDLRGTATWTFINCNSFSNGGYGTHHNTANRGNLYWTSGSIHNNTSGGIDGNATDWVTNALIYANSGDGISSGSSQTNSVYSFNTIYNNTGDGIEFYNATTRNGYKVYGNTLVSNGGYGLNIPTTDANTFLILNYNHTYNNTSGASNITLPGTNQTGDPKFTNAGSGDFTPTAGSPLLGNGPKGTTIGALGMTAGGSTVIVIED